MDNPQDMIRELTETALLGEQVRSFLNTDIGKYLVVRADEHSHSGLLALATVDPEDPKAIRNLQAKIMVGELIKEFLTEAMVRGEEATMALEEMHASR